LPLPRSRPRDSQLQQIETNASATTAQPTTIPSSGWESNEVRRRSAQSMSPEAATLEGLIFCCHDPQRSQVLCGELADIVNTLWTERGDGRRTTPESVGWTLRSVGLRTSPIGAKGNGLRLTEEVKARVHKLSYEYGVPSLEGTVKANCEHCARIIGALSVAGSSRVIGA